MFLCVLCKPGVHDRNREAIKAGGGERKGKRRWRKLQEEMRRKEVKWAILEDVTNKKQQETKLRMKQKRN